MTVPTNSTDLSAVRDKYRNVPPGFAEEAPAVGSPVVDVPAAASSAERAVTAAAWEPSSAPAAAPVRRTPAVTAEPFRARVTSGRTEAAQRGWRAKFNQLFGLHLQKSEDELHYDAQVADIQRTLRASKRIAVISGKGGSGKTTVSLNLGSTIAKLNPGIRVGAMSIDPLGNITDRVWATNSRAARSVVSFTADDQLNSFSDVDHYMLNDKSGLRVLGASTADGAGFLKPGELERAQRVLAAHFNVTITDFGLNYDSEVYHRALAQSDQLVLVTSTLADSINTLGMLLNHLLGLGGRYIELVQNAIVVFVQTRPGDTHIDLADARDKIANERKLPVFTIPFDEHIAEGGPMSLDLLDEDTRLPFVWLAAEVMRKLPLD